MFKKISAVKAIETKEYEDNGIIIGSIIQKKGNNGNTFQSLQLTVKDEKDGKFKAIKNLYNVDQFFFNVIELKKPVEFNSGDKKIGFLKMVPKKGVSLENAFDQSEDD